MNGPEAGWLEPVVAIALDAGAAIMEVYRAPFAVEHKADNSPLTAADLAAHRLITGALARLTPTIPVLSEESGSAVGAGRLGWPRFWLVDPLDGTREFVKRNGEFTVNIALIDAGEPVLGVVYAPALEILYFAARGAGAFRTRNGVREPITTRRPPARPPRICASRSHRGDSLDAMLSRMGDHDLVSIGSSLKLCLVADGQADCYPRLGPTSEWDTAAAQCVVECAGGQVVDTAGHRLRYNKPETLLNPHFLVVGDPAYDWIANLSD